MRPAILLKVILSVILLLATAGIMGVCAAVFAGRAGQSYDLLWASSREL